MNYYGFDVVPENTLRVVITQLDEDYAIARLLDLDEVPSPLWGEVLGKFKRAIEQMGFELIASKTELEYIVNQKIESNVPRGYLEALEKFKWPALLLRRIELEYDPDRF